MTVIDTATPLASIRRRRACVFGDCTAYVTPDRIEIEIEPGRVQSFPVPESLAAGIAVLIAVIEVGCRPAIGQDRPVFDAIASTGWKKTGIARVREIDGRRVLVVGARF